MTIRDDILAELTMDPITRLLVAKIKTPEDMVEHIKQVSYFYFRKNTVWLGERKWKTTLGHPKRSRQIWWQHPGQEQSFWQKQKWEKKDFGVEESLWALILQAVHEPFVPNK